MILGLSLGAWIAIIALFLLRVLLSVYKWWLVRDLQNQLDKIKQKS